MQVLPELLVLLLVPSRVVERVPEKRVDARAIKSKGVGHRRNVGVSILPAPERMFRVAFHLGVDNAVHIGDCPDLRVLLLEPSPDRSRVDDLVWVPKQHQHAAVDVC